MRLMRRLAKAQDDLRKKGIGKEPPRGSYESHCPGGLSHGIKGEPCSEHEDCGYRVPHNYFPTCPLCGGRTGYSAFFVKHPKVGR